MLAKFDGHPSVSCDIVLQRHRSDVMNTYQKITARKYFNKETSSPVNRKRRTFVVASDKQPQSKQPKSVDAFPASDMLKQYGGRTNPDGGFDDGDAAKALLDLCKGISTAEQQKPPRTIPLKTPSTTSLSSTTVDKKISNPVKKQSSVAGKFQHFKKAICRQYSESSQVVPEPEKDVQKSTPSLDDTGGSKQNVEPPSCDPKATSSESGSKLDSDDLAESNPASTSFNKSQHKLYRLSTCLDSSSDSSDSDSSATSVYEDNIESAKSSFPAKRDPFSSTSSSSSLKTSSEDESDYDVILNSIPVATTTTSLQRKFVLNKARFSAPSQQLLNRNPTMTSEKSGHDGNMAMSAQERKVCGSRSPEQRPLLSDSTNKNTVEVEFENAQPTAARTTSTSENSCEKVEPSSPSIFDIRKPSSLFCVHGSTCKGCGHVAPHVSTCTDSTVNQQSIMYPTTSPANKARKRRRKRAPHMKLVNSTVFSVSFKNRSKHQQQPKLQITDQCRLPPFEQESESSSSSSDLPVEQSPQPVHPRRKSRKSKQILDKKNPPKVRRPSLDTVKNDPLSLTSSVPMRCGESKLLTFNDVTSDNVTSKPLKAINFRLSSLFSIPAALTPGVARAELRCAVKTPLLSEQLSGWTKGDDVTMTKQRRQREKWRAMTLDMFCMGGF